MITNAIISIVVSVVNVAFSWLPKINALPTILNVNMDNAFSSIMGTLHGILYAMWPFQIVFYCLLWYYGIKFSILGIKFVTYIINIIRGSGAHAPLQ